MRLGTRGGGAKTASGIRGILEPRRLEPHIVAKTFYISLCSI